MAGRYPLTVTIGQTVFHEDYEPGKDYGIERAWMSRDRSVAASKRAAIYKHFPFVKRGVPLLEQYPRVFVSWGDEDAFTDFTWIRGSEPTSFDPGKVRMTLTFEKPRPAKPASDPAGVVIDAYDMLSVPDKIRVSTHIQEDEHVRTERSLMFSDAEIMSALKLTGNDTDKAMRFLKAVENPYM